MNTVQRAVGFACQGAWLQGIITLPATETAAGNAAPPNGGTRGVLVVVGGPQYRVGSHRQFRLLADQLAAGGTPVLRFDYRGMGDSDGDVRDFGAVDDDLRAAINHFFHEVPTLGEVVIWGLCDGASAALFYAHRDARVRGLVLLNPWVRTEGGEARAYLKHYYLSRLRSPELWRKVLGGGFDFRAAATSLASKLVTAARGSATTSDVPIKPVHESGSRSPSAAPVMPADSRPLPQRMQEGLERFRGKVLLILSGNDLTAREFCDLAAGSAAWQKLLRAPRIEQRNLAAANHTFSRQDWRGQVGAWTAEWMASW